MIPVSGVIEPVRGWPTNRPVTPNRPIPKPVTDLKAAVERAIQESGLDPYLEAEVVESGVEAHKGKLLVSPVGLVPASVLPWNQRDKIDAVIFKPFFDNLHFKRGMEYTAGGFRFFSSPLFY